MKKTIIIIVIIITIIIIMIIMIIAMAIDMLLLSVAGWFCFRVSFFVQFYFDYKI